MIRFHRMCPVYTELVIVNICMESECWEVRETACLSVSEFRGVYGAGSAAMTDTMAEDLGKDESSHICKAACLALGNIGGRGSMHVAAALEHDHPGVLSAALNVIAKMGVDGTTHLEAVLAKLHHDRWNVQLNAVYALAKIGISNSERWESKVGEDFII